MANFKLFEVTTPGRSFLLLGYPDKCFRGFPQSSQAKVFSCLLFTNHRCYMIRTTKSELKLRLNKQIHSIKIPFCVLVLDFLKRTHVSLIPDGCNVYLLFSNNYAFRSIYFTQLQMCPLYKY